MHLQIDFLCVWTAIEQIGAGRCSVAIETRPDLSPMPDLATYLAFLAAVLAYQLAGPGPDMLLVMSRGIGQGWRAALATALGCVAAGFIQIPLLAMGVASLVAA